MARKLQCVVIDNDPKFHRSLTSSLSNSTLAEVKHNFYSPSEFLVNINSIEFDLCFIECFFNKDILHGTDIAIKLKELNKYFVFISSDQKSFIEACRLIGPLDAIPKPFNEKRINDSIEYAYSMLLRPQSKIEKEHILCYIAESKGKVSIPIKDILYIRTDSIDPRNKIAQLKNHISYTLMDYKFSELLKLSSKFSLVNRSEVISYEIVEEIKGEFIYLKQQENRELPRTITLSKTCRKNFNLNFY